MSVSFYRHTLPTRVMHWIAAVCIFTMLMSGLQIFNAHPRLYWGQSGADSDVAAFEIASRTAADGDAVGLVRIMGHEVRTTGVLGVSSGSDGDLTRRAFPGWMTLPSWQDLATGRRWHLFFAWLLVANSVVYLAFSFATGHVRRDLLPARADLSVARLAHDLWAHLKLSFPKGEAARPYNPLQKLSYLGVLFLLAPFILATGLTLSPAVDAAWPWLLDVLDGRQSARTLHFFGAALVVVFILVHLAMVVLAGPWNELRSMITGRYVLPTDVPP